MEFITGMLLGFVGLIWFLGGYYVLISVPHIKNAAEVKRTTPRPLFLLLIFIGWPMFTLMALLGK